MWASWSYILSNTTVILVWCINLFCFVVTMNPRPRAGERQTIACPCPLEPRAVAAEGDCCTEEEPLILDGNTYVALENRSPWLFSAWSTTARVVRFSTLKTGLLEAGVPDEDWIPQSVENVGEVFDVFIGVRGEGRPVVTRWSCGVAKPLNACSDSFSRENFWNLPLFVAVLDTPLRSTQRLRTRKM